MKELFDFLNSQSSGRLVLFAIVFISTVYYIMQGLVFIFQSIFNKKS